MQCTIMHTMSEENRNPPIRVLPKTHKKLKLLAAYYETSMLELVEQLVQAEVERIHQKGEQSDKDIQIPLVSDESRD